MLEPHPADIQDRDGGGPVLAASRHAFPFIAKVFADSGYAGKRVAGATAIAVEIVRKNPDQIGFAVQPRRWVVERFFAWIGRNRRLAKDFEEPLDPPSLPLAASTCCSPDGSRYQDEFRSRTLGAVVPFALLHSRIDLDDSFDDCFTLPGLSTIGPFGAAKWWPRRNRPIVRGCAPLADWRSEWRPFILAAILSLAAFSASAQTATTCKSQADEKKLAGAAPKSFMTKCERDAKATCDTSAKDKKLAGAAQNKLHQEVRHRRDGNVARGARRSDPGAVLALARCCPTSS